MNLCPHCHSCPSISRSYTKLKGETIEDAQVYTVIEQVCKNPSCPSYNKVIDTIEHLQDVER